MRGSIQHVGSRWVSVMRLAVLVPDICRYYTFGGRTTSTSLGARICPADHSHSLHENCCVENTTEQTSKAHCKVLCFAFSSFLPHFLALFCIIWGIMSTSARRRLLRDFKRWVSGFIGFLVLWCFVIIEPLQRLVRISTRYRVENILPSSASRNDSNRGRLGCFLETSTHGILVVVSVRLKCGWFCWVGWVDLSRVHMLP
jgi:hypothetical protein